MSRTSLMPVENPPVQAYSVLIMGVIAVSLGSIFIRLAQNEGMPSLLVAAGRVTIASLILTLPVLRRYSDYIRQLEKRDWLLLGMAGLFLAVHFATWVSSLEYTSVLISVALVNTNPLWVAVLEVLFLKARLSRAMLFALALAFAGGLILVLPGSGTIELGKSPVLGAALAVTGAASVAVYFTTGRKLRAKLPLLPYIWLVYGMASLVLIAVLLMTGTQVTGYSAAGYFWLVVMAVIPQLVGHSALNYALGYLQATFVTLSSQLEPAVSAIFAFFLFQETPGWLQVLGSVTILAGIILATASQRYQKA